jgi:hypothetical protein
MYYVLIKNATLKQTDSLCGTWTLSLHTTQPELNGLCIQLYSQ